jgi:hypothetical protein
MSKKHKLNTPEGRTEFAKESEAAAPENAMALSLFGAPAENSALEKLMEKAERRNMPQMIKPGEVPLGGIVSGEIVKIVDSPVSTVKGKLLWLRHDNGTEFLFPCTGVVRNALAPGMEPGKELQAALEKEIGKTFIAKRLPSKTSAKYKKEMYMFDVFTVKQ